MLSAAERSHPTSEVRGRSREDPMPKGRRPRGVTPHPRSGAGAESARLRQHRKGREELPRIRGQGRRQRSYPVSEIRGIGRDKLPHAPTPEARRSNPTPKARCGGREYQPHIQGTMAARAQEGLGELSHIEGQEGWR